MYMGLTVFNFGKYAMELNTTSMDVYVDEHGVWVIPVPIYGMQIVIYASYFPGETSKIKIALRRNNVVADPLSKPKYMR